MQCGEKIVGVAPCEAFSCIGPPHPIPGTGTQATKMGVVCGATGKTVAQFPALPFWTDAYLGDTTHLTTLEHGAYLLLLMAMWRNGAALPNDPKLLARYARLTPGQWRRIEATIMKFFDVGEAQITQGRLTDEYNAVKQKSESASANAKARWLKNNNSHDAGALVPQSERNAILNLNLNLEKEKINKKEKALTWHERVQEENRKILDDL